MATYLTMMAVLQIAHSNLDLFVKLILSHLCLRRVFLFAEMELLEDLRIVTISIC